jgi:uncharacterized protein
VPPPSRAAVRIFGSAVRGDFDPEHSDIDVLVEFDREHPEALSFETYLRLKEALEALLRPPVDLIEASTVAQSLT